MACLNNCTARVAGSHGNYRLSFSPSLLNWTFGLQQESTTSHFVRSNLKMKRESFRLRKAIDPYVLTYLFAGMLRAEKPKPYFILHATGFSYMWPACLQTCTKVISLIQACWWTLYAAIVGTTVMHYSYFAHCDRKSLDHCFYAGYTVLYDACCELWTLQCIGALWITVSAWFPPFVIQLFDQHRSLIKVLHGFKHTPSQQGWISPKWVLPKWVPVLSLIKPY